LAFSDDSPEPDSFENVVTDKSIQIISQVERIKQIYLALIRNAQTEVLLIFPTANAVRREEGVGIFFELRRAAQRGVNVRILTPEDDFVKAQLDELRSMGIIVRQIEAPSETKFKLLVIDSKFSLVIETKDDSKRIFEQAVGLATLSNSKPTVLPFVTIFESFWRETDLYERAREADRIKDEFVNIAAHELRNPISPIMASAEFAMDEIRNLQTEGKAVREDLDSLAQNISIIVRNSSKLYKLSEDILQVSRIESGTFTLNIEPVNIRVLLELAIEDAKKKVQNEDKPIDIELDFRLKNLDFSLYCDNSKLNQVLYNLLDNAIKFTSKGMITISTAMHDDTDVLFRVEDSGTGIDPDMKSKLFVKFASKSHGGTGLGLYLAKKIVEAHGGRIWATAGQSGSGAVFAFTLPRDLRPVEREHKPDSRSKLDKYAQ
jgi:two-component system, OmpR family, sensor histidine kinase VicK